MMPGIVSRLLSVAGNECVFCEREADRLRSSDTLCIQDDHNDGDRDEKKYKEYFDDAVPGMILKEHIKDQPEHEDDQKIQDGIFPEPCKIFFT